VVANDAPFNVTVTLKDAVGNTVKDTGECHSLPTSHSGMLYFTMAYHDECVAQSWPLVRHCSTSHAANSHCVCLRAAVLQLVHFTTCCSTGQTSSFSLGLM
jgi:hypothetical protein